MGELLFSKMQGTGNDFIVINGFEFPDLSTTLTNQKIRTLCDRKFGIGADGLIILEPDSNVDFKMVYYNADGKESTMCGNGGRCAVRAAKSWLNLDDAFAFNAIDGVHEASLCRDSIRLAMQNVNSIQVSGDAYILDTGSPHYILFVEDATAINVPVEGAKIRYSQNFKSEGINVNFVQTTSNGLIVRTYERGVEDETLSCGTGVTAAVLAFAEMKDIAQKEIKVMTAGGELAVSFVKRDNQYQDIFLIGPSSFVFDGSIEI